MIRVGTGRTMPQAMILIALLSTTACTKLHLFGSKGSSASGSTPGASFGQPGNQSTQTDNGPARLTNMVTAILHRTPSKAELDGLSHLAGDPQKAVSVLNQLIRSTDRRTMVLSSVSQSTVGREPTAVESSFYLQIGDQPGSPGQREELVGYLSSSEAQTRASSQGVTYVDYVFQQLYNRPPTDLERQEFGEAQKRHSLQTVILANTLTPEFSQDWVTNALHQLGNPSVPSDVITTCENDIQTGGRFEDELAKLVAAALPK